MKTININYMNRSYNINVTKVNAYPNNLLKVEFDDELKLLDIIESPIYIEMKNNILSFTHVETNSLVQLELLNSIYEAII
jgi:hypothetical protein